MGIIKALAESVSGGFRDQWLEVVEPDGMGERTVLTSGVKIRKGENRKGTDHTVSNGSVIHVYDNQFMMLVDGGKIVDYTAEPGYYTVDNSAMPSLFNGQFKDTLKESFQRIKYGGQTPTMQKVFYLNLQEIKGIKFGTRNPINYFDCFYNAELFLRTHGTYSIKITDPFKFYQEAIPRNAGQVEIEDINEQYISEFLEALQSAINQMSADGVRISHVTSKARELGKYMADTLDDDWRQMRGMEIQAVGIAGLNYDEKSREMIDTRNEGAMLSDPVIREGYVQKNIAQGLRDAGSNANGAMAGFMGMGLGMQATGGMMGAASATNLQQMQMQQPQQNQPQNGTPVPSFVKEQQAAQEAKPAGWTCECGALNTGKFCSECGNPKPQAAESWICVCGTENTGNFCSECGNKRPEAEGAWTCACGAVNTGKFCSECGSKRG